jgi:hypothetical protein
MKLPHARPSPRAALARRTRATRRPLPERLRLWRARPLPPNLLRYASDDVRWLPDLARRLGALADRGQGLELDGETGALVAELSQCQVRRTTHGCEGWTGGRISSLG